MELIVMLTHNDKTVKNAYEIFEIRSEEEFPYSYEIVEEDHHFEKKEDKYYRVSKIYRNTIEKSTKNIINKELIWDNHSMVMFDYDLIPKDELRV